jgi:hypothetical protein
MPMQAAPKRPAALDLADCDQSDIRFAGLATKWRGTLRDPRDTDSDREAEGASEREMCENRDVLLEIIEHGAEPLKR